MMNRAMAGDTYEIPLAPRRFTEAVPVAVLITAVRPPVAFYVPTEALGAEPVELPLETFERDSAKLIDAGPVRLSWARTVAVPPDRYDSISVGGRDLPR